PDRIARVLFGCNRCDSCTQRVEFPCTLQRTESAEDSVGRRAIWRQYFEQPSHHAVEAIVLAHQAIGICKSEKVLSSSWLKRNCPFEGAHRVIPTTLTTRNCPGTCLQLGVIRHGATGKVDFDTCLLDVVVGQKEMTSQCQMHLSKVRLHPLGFLQRGFGQSPM